MVTSDRKLGAALPDLTLAHDAGWGTPAVLTVAVLQLHGHGSLKAGVLLFGAQSVVQAQPVTCLPWLSIATQPSSCKLGCSEGTLLAKRILLLQYL